MNRSPMNSLLRRLAADAIPPAEVDLWPAVLSRFETRKAHAKGDFYMNRSFSQHRRLYWAAVPITIVLIIAAVLLLTPQGRAWAQSTLQFFNRTENDTIPVPTDQPLVWVEQTPGVPAPTMTPLPPRAPFVTDCGDYRDPRCSVEQMRSKVKFTVKELASIPEGLYFSGATGGPEEAFLRYETVDGSRSLFLFEQPWSGSPEQKPFEVAPGVAVETVPIGGVTGEYVRGSYGYKAGETVETWMSDNGQETLKWSDQGVYYTLVYISAGIPQGKAGLAALAASITTEPVSANLPSMLATATEIPTPVPDRWNAVFPLTPAQASEQAGFAVAVPSRMPHILRFIGARYDTEGHMVVLFFLLNCGDCDNGLVLSEQPAPDGADCDLCGFVVGDDENNADVGTGATIETVQIGDGTGQYVKGGWKSNNVTGFEWTNVPPFGEEQRLRWEKDGIAFALMDMTWGDLSKEDLIAIAESMVKVQVESNTSMQPATATPEVVNYNSLYTLTIAQAEEQAGFELRLPGILPEGFTLEGARFYDAERKIVNIYYILSSEEAGLAVLEQPISNTYGCAICGIEVGDIDTLDKSVWGPMLVGANAKIETVQIGETLGLYVAGYWHKPDINGSVWESDPYVIRIRWQRDGMAFELSYAGMVIVKEDLIAIAESIR